MRAVRAAPAGAAEARLGEPREAGVWERPGGPRGILRLMKAYSGLSRVEASSYNSSGEAAE